MEGSPPEPQHVNVFLPESQIGGVWANFARVSHSEHEFTLDFVRLDYGMDPPAGIVVARVGVSPLFITQLIDALGDNWKKYAEKALPKEFQDESAEDRSADGGEGDDPHGNP